MCTKIITADENTVYRIGLRHLLESTADVEIIAEASNGEELLTHLQFKTPDVVLLDLSIPKVNGLELLAKIADHNKKKKMQIKPVVLTELDDENDILNAIEEGACCFLSKRSTTNEIVKAIEHVAVEGSYYNDRVNKALVRRVTRQKNLKKTLDETGTFFTDTEIKVLKLICSEMTSTTIAKQLYLSPRTIEAIRLKLIKKANVKNTIGLVLWAAKCGLIEIC